MTCQRHLCALAVLAASSVSLGSIVIDGRAVLFDAARLSPSPGLGGVLPPSITLPAGSGRYVEFTSVTGAVGFGLSDPPTPPTAPDGYDYPSGMDINSLNGISGMRGPRYAFLAAVFTTDDVPTDPAPVRLDFGLIGFGFATLAPALNQSFYVGDGLTGTGTGSLQRFFVPDGATRVFLGILDAGGVVGNPGMYADNFGAYSAEVVALPSPCAVAAIMLCLPVVRRRRFDRRD